LIRAFQAPMSRIERFALLAGLLLCAALMWPLRDAQVDPTFIHLRYARALADGEGIVFNPGDRVYACTSPLWVALLADGMAFGLPGLAVARVLGAFATLASIALFLQLARRTIQSPAFRAFATLTWAGHAWMIAWSTSGMETAFAVSLTLAGFVAFTEGKQWGARPVRTSALWGLACLARPELVFLVVLWFMVILIDAQNRDGLRRLVFGIIPAAAIYGGWLMFARIYYGTFWPLALSARSEPAAGGGGRGAALAEQIRLAGATDAVLLVLLVVALLVARRRAWLAPARAQTVLPWLWITLLPALYVSRGIAVQSRYLLVVLPVMGWLAWRTAEIAWGGGGDPAARPSRRFTLLGAAIAALALLQNLALYRSTVLPEVQAASVALEQGPIAWGRWYDLHAAPDATIATSHVGAIGYFGRRRIFDLSGGVTPEMAELLRDTAVEDATARFVFARFARPQFLVDRAPRAYDLERRSRFGPALTPLGVSTVQSGDWGRARRAVDTHYRLDWPRADTLFATP
jgi:hypothetical protein